MLNDLAASFARVWSDLTGGLHAPLAFRFIVSAARGGVLRHSCGRRDALEGRPLFFWAVLRDPVQRRERLREAWKHIGKVFLAAVVIDVVYQTSWSAGSIPRSDRRRRNPRGAAVPGAFGIVNACCATRLRAANDLTQGESA